MVHASPCVGLSSAPTAGFLALASYETTFPGCPGSLVLRVTTKALPIMLGKWG